MATADQIRALIRSHASGDSERFDAIAMQIAAQSARQGQGDLAKEIRGIVEQSRLRATSAVPLPISKPRAELSGLIRASYPKTRLTDMVLSKSAAAELERLVSEQQRRDQLREHAIEPRRKILLVGPPGCGKSMTAGVLAGECHLPLLRVQLHMLISRYLGETAAKLSQVFDAMADTRGVYFFDEFDAIGADRKGENDVGEVRRVLNTFLQLVEHDESDSILVAATNLGNMLDAALFRRFDCVIHYELPSPAAIRELIQRRLTVRVTPGAINKTVVAAAGGLSHAEVAQACDDAARTAVMNDENMVSRDVLLTAVRARKLMGARA